MTAATVPTSTFTDVELVAAACDSGDRRGWPNARTARVTAELRVLRTLAIAGATMTYGQFAELVQPDPLLADPATGQQLNYARDVCLDHGRRALGSLVVSRVTGEVSTGWHSGDGLSAAETRAAVWAAYGARRTPAL